MYDEFIGLTDEQLLETIELRFGKDAAEHLKKFGKLSLRDALYYQNGEKSFWTAGDLIGFTLNEGGPRVI